MTTDRDWLLASWDALIQRLGFTAAAGLGRQLLSRYCEPHRAFHTPRHLRQVIQTLAEVGTDDRLILAAWFHDAIYAPGAADNESRSAALAHRELGRIGAPEVLRRFVADAVMATASHVPQRPEYAPLVDADLSILGSAPGQYEEYRTSIRKEFQAMDDAAFRAGRAAFIRVVLARPGIFHTPAGRERFEAAARRNLQSELSCLG